MKTWGSGCVDRLEVRGQLHAPAALPRVVQPAVPIGEEAGWTPESIWTLLRSDRTGTRILTPRLSNQLR
jgi:hypothetical protein